MQYRLLADLIVATHFTFVIFVLVGGLLALRWHKAVLVHIPCAIWGILIEARGWICPLTPLENRFRRLAGEAGYAGGFIEHYVIPILYPAGLTRATQWIMAGIVVFVNVVIYGIVLTRWRNGRGSRA